ncbi:MAG: hypothetical protein Q7R35_19060 [Elusimicrobiota bacterium]|nr:hypothetical protein [Elusimicrobiota bacterium]
MKKIILTAVCGLFAASLNAADNLNFTDAAFAKQLSAATSAPEVKAPEAAKPAKVRAGRYFQVSGNVYLTGTGFLSGTTANYTSITLSGWANFRDSSGQVTSNNSYINVYSSMWITPNQYVMQTVWPNVYTQFYYKGKPVGSASMSGSVSVSGFPSGNYVSLNGSGYLSGSIYVADAE